MIKNIRKGQFVSVSVEVGSCIKTKYPIFKTVPAVVVGFESTGVIVTCLSGDTEIKTVNAIYID